jgi:hypothetical protein
MNMAIQTCFVLANRNDHSFDLEFQKKELTDVRMEVARASRGSDLPGDLP